MASGAQQNDPSFAASMAYNGASEDLFYANVQGILVPSAARTVTPAIPTQANPNHRGVWLYLNITSPSGTGADTLTVTLQALDPVSASPLTLFAPTALAASVGSGLYSILYYPGATAAAAMTKNGAPAAANGVLPRTWTVTVVPSAANSWTYSLAYSLVL